MTKPKTPEEIAYVIFKSWKSSLGSDAIKLIAQAVQAERDRAKVLEECLETIVSGWGDCMEVIAESVEREDGVGVAVADLTVEMVEDYFDFAGLGVHDLRDALASRMISASKALAQYRGEEL